MEQCIKRKIQFKEPLIDIEDLVKVTEIIPATEIHFDKYKYDFKFNDCVDFYINIEQLDLLSKEYEIVLTSEYILIKN